MKSLITTFLLVCASLSFAEGISSGGGTDRVKNGTMMDDFAWFVGTRPVKACLNVDAGFGVTKETLSRDVQSTFNTWVQYLNARAMSGQTQHIANQITINANCDGTEDLLVYFGGTSAEVETAKKQFVDPAGMAEVTKASPGDYSRGFIWIDNIKGNDDKTHDQIYGLLLHEMGHTFGNQHVDGTIMDRTLAKTLFGWLQPAELKVLTHSIDNKRELVSCFACRSSYFELNKTSKDDIEVFNSLVGRLPVGPFKAKFLVGSEMRLEEQVTHMDGASAFPKDQVVLELKDAAGAKRLPLVMKLRKTLSSGFELGHIFNFVKMIGHSQNAWTLGSSPSTEIEAMVRDANGANHDITITINGGDGNFVRAEIEMEMPDGWKVVGLLSSGPVSGLGDRDKVNSLPKTCSIDTLEPHIKMSIKNTLLEIKPDLDMSTLKITRSKTTSFMNHAFQDYTVEVRDKKGSQYHVATFIQERSTQKLGKAVGGFLTSDAILSKRNIVSVGGGGSTSSEELDGTVGTCSSQSLASVSLFSFAPKIFASRLVDSKGRVVTGKKADSFDLNLRTAQVEIYGN